MRLLQVQDSIAELMSKFVYQVEAYTALGRTDINKLSEVVLIPLFKEVFGYSNLRNLNTTEGVNYPAIDLADDAARVAFQVTSTPDNEKVKHTLRQFIQEELYKKYDRLIIYILTKRQRSYSDSSYPSILQSKFGFSTEHDIWDSRTVLDAMKGFQIDKAHRVLEILKKNFGPPDPTALRRLLNSPHPTSSIIGPSLPQETETLSLNLLEMSFPKTLYLADIAEDITNEVPEPPSLQGQMWKKPRRIRRRVSSRLAVQAALHELDIHFSADWNCFERKIITFHDLSDPHLPLSAVIDLGTVTPINTEEFCKIDKEHEKVVKYLLRRCLQQKLYSRQVVWQNEEDLFIFTDIQGQEARLESWFGKKDSTRTVYERVMKTDKPDESWYHKHLAFGVQFYNFAGKWYLGIKPDWFFSFDGYHSSFYGADKIKWLKRHENNGQVFNHLRFIVYFLTATDIFTDNLEPDYPFLRFGNLETFSGAPKLIDKIWNPPKSEKEKKRKDSKAKEDLQNEGFIQTDFGF
jgi:hypothetical protein